MQYKLFGGPYHGYISDINKMKPLTKYVRVNLYGKLWVGYYKVNTLFKATMEWVPYLAYK